jgi:hypothetical protein
MNERVRSVLGKTLGFVVGLGAVIALWDLPMSLGIIAGSLWNAASLWCLSGLLQAWLGPQPSRRRVIGWLLLKFPLLYLALLGLAGCPEISMVGFGIGCSLVLLIVLGWCIARARAPLVHSHGR